MFTKLGSKTKIEKFTKLPENLSDLEDPPPMENKYNCIILDDFQDELGKILFNLNIIIILLIVRK